MNDVNHAIANLRDLTGLRDLDLSQDGHLELIFDKTLSVDFVKIDSETLELSTTLKIDPRQLDEKKLLGFLAASGDKTMVGGGRLCLDHRDNTVLLCERIDVIPIGAKQFEERILEFVKFASLWASGEGEERMRMAGNAGSSKNDGELSGESWEDYAMRL